MWHAPKDDKHVTLIVSKTLMLDTGSTWEDNIKGGLKGADWKNVDVAVSEYELMAGCVECSNESPGYEWRRWISRTVSF